MQVAPGVIVKDNGIGWEDFTQVAVLVKVKKLPKVLKSNIINN